MTYKDTLHDSSIRPSVTEAKGQEPLLIDLEKYRKDLSGFEMTTEQENELLQVLWNIMSIFVDIGWGVDTVQLVLPDLFKEVAPDSEKRIESDTAQLFNQTAASVKGLKHD